MEASPITNRKEIITKIASRILFKLSKFILIINLSLYLNVWGRQDLNLESIGLEPIALAKLNYAPYILGGI